jgi:hypothetical protein
MTDRLSSFIGAAGKLASHLEKTRPATSTADTASVTEGAGETANVEGTPAPKAPFSKRGAAKIKLPSKINLGPAGALINEDFGDVELADADEKEGAAKSEPYKSPAELTTERMVDKTNPLGVKVPAPAKKPRRSRTGGSFSNTEGLVTESSDVLKAKSSNDTLRHAAEHLANGTCSNGSCVHNVVNRGPAGLAWAFPAPEKATPKGRRNSEGRLIPEGVGEGAAHDAWNAAKDLHTVLLRHSETLEPQLNARADELESRVQSARNIIAQSGGLVDKDQQSIDKSIANVSNTAAYLRGQGKTDSLREQRTGHDNLVQIGAGLDSMKTPDGKFKTAYAEDPRRLHGDIQDALSSLRRIHDLYQNNAVAPFGVGSPVADEDVKHAVNVAKKLTTKSAEVSPSMLPRDAHPLAEKDNDKNIKNPDSELGLAPAGHVWGVGLPNDLKTGKLRTVEATPENLELVSKALGEKHTTTNRLRSLVKARFNGGKLSGSWFNADGTQYGKKSKTELVKSTLSEPNEAGATEAQQNRQIVDPETFAQAEKSRQRSITTKTTMVGGKTGFAVTKPIEDADYVPATADDETDVVGDRDAEPGRMLSGDGKKVWKISLDSLKSLTNLKGEDHPDTVKMDKLYREAKGLPTKEEEQASAQIRGINYEKNLGKSGKTVGESPIGGPAVVASTGATEGKGIQEPVTRTSEFERTVPGAQDALIEEAAGHITAGRAIPRDLRRTIGMEGIIAAHSKAGKPLVRAQRNPRNAPSAYLTDPGEYNPPTTDLAEHIKANGNMIMAPAEISVEGVGARLISTNPLAKVQREVRQSDLDQAKRDYDDRYVRQGGRLP